MQNAWRFVTDPPLRERLKEAKGIGTPATRAEIIKGLKRQKLLAAKGKLVVPTPAGLEIFELLRSAVPSVVDPATTAAWEMQLDDIVSGRADFRAVIDGISEMAGQLIQVLQRHTGGSVHINSPTSAKSGRRRKPTGSRGAGSGSSGQKTRGRKKQITARASKTETAAGVTPNQSNTTMGNSSSSPTDKMKSFAVSLSGKLGVKLPKGYDQDFSICRKFLDQHAS